MYFTRVTIALTSLLAMLLPIVTVNAAHSQIEIISIEETSGSSVEITFNSRIVKKQISHFTITASPDLSGITQSGNSSLQQNKQISKKLNKKATGLIIYEFKPIPTAVPYLFKVCAKSITGKTICSDSLKHPQLADLFEQISRLASDWGNPKPIQLPDTSPAPAPANLSAPAFTLTSSNESRTVNTAATGFTINSTGGAIASFAINATPPGMSFNTTTGALTGTPNTVAVATNYTIIATNASGSATQSFGLTVTVVVYTVGQAGPGGGIIFYVASTPFACGPTRAANCTYLEAAPSGWNGGADPARSWAQQTPVDYQSTEVPGNGATATEIGWGYRNTRAIIAQGNTNTATSAAALADSHTATVSGVVYDDWYLPSTDELNQLWTERISVGGYEANTYWSSSEDTQNRAQYKVFNGFRGDQGKSNEGSLVRPVRAF